MCLGQANHGVNHAHDHTPNALAYNNLSYIFKPFNQAHLPAAETRNTGVLMTPEQQTERRVLEWRTIVGGYDITTRCYILEICLQA